ncbi:MAG: GIY-YIG nuclease family protein [Planctomycetes bacterium]|nr:GIY-YIG nuclease family protein [Planctomycetota bacterium]
MRRYYVYIMTNKSRSLYTGVTNDLERRVFEHKHKLIPGFTSKYNITQLVWFEDFDDIMQAIEGEKRIKGWRRSKKIALIESKNSNWRDLAQDWFVAGSPAGNVDPSVAKPSSG